MSDFDPEREQAVREKTVELDSALFGRAFAQNTRELAAQFNVTMIEDMKPREALAAYMQRPPIGLDGMPPPDEPGVFPMWFSMAAELPAKYQEHVTRFIRLARDMMRDAAPR